MTTIEEVRNRWDRFPKCDGNLLDPLVDLVDRVVEKNESPSPETPAPAKTMYVGDDIEDLIAQVAAHVGESVTAIITLPRNRANDAPRLYPCGWESEVA